MKKPVKHVPFSTAKWRVKALTNLSTLCLEKKIFFKSVFTQESFLWRFESCVSCLYKKCLYWAVAGIFFFPMLIWPDLIWVHSLSPLSKGPCLFGAVDMFERTPGWDIPPSSLWGGGRMFACLFWLVIHWFWQWRANTSRHQLSHCTFPTMGSLAEMGTVPFHGHKGSH